MGPQRLKLADVLAFLAGETVGYKHWWADPESVVVGRDLTWTWRARKPRGVYYHKTRTVPIVYRDKDEAWEAMIVRGSIPQAWGFNPSRRFDSAEYPGTNARPDTISAMASFLSFGVETIEKVEVQVREASRRLEVWGEPPLKEILWLGIPWKFPGDTSYLLRSRWSFFQYLNHYPTSRDILSFSEVSKPLDDGRAASFVENMRWTGLAEAQAGFELWDRILQSTPHSPEQAPNVFEPILAIYKAGFGFYRLADGQATILYTLLGP